MTRIAAAALSLNSGWFALIHIAWAFGWRWGLPAQMPPISQRPWFLAYDLAAALAMLVLASVSARIAVSPSRLAARGVYLFMFATAVVCAVRAGIGIPGDVAAWRDGTLTVLTVVADAWFLVTAALASTLFLRARSARTPRVESR